MKNHIPLLFAVFFILAALFILGCKGDISGTTEPGPVWVTFVAGSSPLPSSIVNAVYVDRELRVWFATPLGAAYFKDKSWAIIRDSLKYYVYDNGGNSYANYNVTCITEGKDRSIWFGLRGGGAARFNAYSSTGTIWQRWRSPSISSDYVAAIAGDLSDATLNGEMWFVSGGGVDRFIQNSTDGGSWVTYQVPPSPTVVVESPYDFSIWIGSASDGLENITYDPPPMKFTPVHLPAGYVGQVTGIAFDGQNNVWISKDIGISAINTVTGDWQHFTNANTNGKLPPGEIHAVASDLGSNRWFGTDSGLVHLVDTTWSRFTMANSPLPNDTVTALRYDQRGNLWIGTRNGAAAYKPDGTRF